ncbi:MAG: menaquinone biosynthesis protein, partial [bacterium]|nr:menaquinone biosynthesis protein [bacterium]
IDLAPASSLEYGLHPDRYFILPDLSISSGHEVQSVILLSRIPVENLDGKSILLSPASASSNALVRILLEKRYGIDCRYAYADGEGSTIPREYDARVAIGDNALKAYLNPSAMLHLYDLSVLWRDFTGLPFVFALWLVSREAAKREPENVRRIVQRLQEARNYAQSHFAELAGKFGQELDIPASALVRYWESISYDLSSEKIDSLHQYFDYAVELGFIPENPTLNFFSG